MGSIDLHDYHLKGLRFLNNELFLSTASLSTGLETGFEVSNGFAEMTCGMSGYLRPEEQLGWYKADTQVLSSDRVDISFQSGFSGTTSRVSVLRIEPLTAQDNGLYTCRLSGSSITSQQISINSNSINTGIGWCILYTCDTDTI